MGAFMVVWAGKERRTGADVRVTGDSTGSVVALAPACREALMRSAQAAYPRECCGLLVGSAGVEADPAEARVRRIVQVVPVPNGADQDTSHGRSSRDGFVIEPSALLEAERAAAQAGLEVVGIYHSHPDGAAVVSELDAARMFPQCSYLVISCVMGRAAAMRSWCVVTRHGQWLGVEEERIVVVSQGLAKQDGAGDVD